MKRPRNGRQVLSFATGAPVTCIPIQGRGRTLAGTLSIYSCLGEATWVARPRR
ncbi:MAG TPA: hypothetical protein VFM57_13600 [Thermoleophilaceae bacterium]|nr:hypothetical protein [Thermoleophilaceae bacterium]